MSCEVNRCNKPVYKSVITEYSAFGHEYMDLCKDHYDKHMEEKRKPKRGYCEHCGNENAEDVKPFQDPEEGCSAVFLDTCAKCRKRINEAFCDE